MKSINQQAQEDGDSSANEAERIREREASVKRVWRGISYAEGDQACTAARISMHTGLPIAYVRLICERHGYVLAE